MRLERFDVYETHPGRWCVYDRVKGGHFPFDWGSREEALADARRMMVEAARGERQLELIMDEDV